MNIEDFDSIENDVVAYVNRIFKYLGEVERLMRNSVVDLDSRVEADRIRGLLNAFVVNMTNEVREKREQYLKETREAE